MVIPSSLWVPTVASAGGLTTVEPPTTRCTSRCPISSPTSVRRVGPRDYQARVGKDGDGEPFVRHLLVEGIERIGGDTHDLIDAQRVKLTDIRLDILELVPTRLAGESFLEIEQD